MPRQKITSKAAKPAPIPLGKAAIKARQKWGRAIDADPEHVCDYIGTLAAELAELALHNRLDALAVACDVVREIADGNVKSHPRHVDGRATRHN